MQDVYLSFFVAALKADGTPDTEHPVMCAMPHTAPYVSPHNTGKWIKCGVGASELLLAGNGTAPKPNSSAWQPTPLYFDPEEADLDTARDYAFILEGGCGASGCTSMGDADYHNFEVGMASKTGGSSGSMTFTRSGGWKPDADAVVASFFTVGAPELGYKPNQLHRDWVA